MKTPSVSNRLGFRITFIYVVIAGCWIFFSDRFIASMIDNIALLVQIQTYKGLFFVVVTGGLLYYLITKNTASIERSNQRLEEMVHQKQVLLGELHHRVKNNLAIITGLIELQAAELTGDSQNLLKTTQYRIYSLADIQELLFQQKNLTSIPFHEYLDQLIRSVNGSYQKHPVHITVDELELNINQAVPLGLLINEMFSQVKLNGYHAPNFSVDFKLLHREERNVSIQFTFHNPPEQVLEKLRNPNTHLESTLIRLYSKQLRASSSWEETRNRIYFNLEFEKSNRLGSSSSLKISKAS